MDWCFECAKYKFGVDKTYLIFEIAIKSVCQIASLIINEDSLFQKRIFYGFKNVYFTKPIWPETDS